MNNQPNKHMQQLIYRNQTLEFQALFMGAAMNHIAKLAFTTRDEYLIWVKQWKEVYNNIVHLYIIQKHEWHSGHCITKERQDWYMAKANRERAKIGFWSKEEAQLKVKELEGQIKKEYGMYVSRFYVDLMYLLVVRKAGKIRANTQRNTRLATIMHQEKQAVAV
jgi:hypothetical protein